MDYVITFSHEEDKTHCAALLYHRGAAYEDGVFRKYPYIVVPDTDPETEAFLTDDDRFLDFFGQLKIAAFNKNEANACSFKSNCHTRDLPMVEDIYAQYLKERKERTKNEEGRHIAVYCFGPLGNVTEKLKAIDETLPKLVQKQMEYEKASGLPNTIDSVFTVLGAGWYRQYICNIFPEDGHPKEMTREYLYKVLKGVKNFTRNQNFKHKVTIQIDPESIPIDQEILAEAIEELFDDPENMLCVAL